MALCFWGAPEAIRDIDDIPFGLYFIFQSARAVIPMGVLAIVAIALRTRPLQKRYFWITLTLQILLLWLVPLPLRSDGTLRYVIRQNNTITRVVTGSGLRVLMQVPGFPFLGITIEAQDLRLHTDQINCRFSPVAVSQATNGCEIDHWTIAVDVSVTTDAFEQMPINLQQDEFVVHVNKRVCSALMNVDEIRALHINRVDVLHDAAAQDAVADLVERALSDLKLSTRNRPRISVRTTAQPPADVCNP